MTSLDDVAAEKARRRADPLVAAIIARGYPPGYPVTREQAEDCVVRGYRRALLLRGEGATDADIAVVLCGSRRYWRHY